MSWEGRDAGGGLKAEPALQPRAEGPGDSPHPEGCSRVPEPLRVCVCELGRGSGPGRAKGITEATTKVTTDILVKAVGFPTTFFCWVWSTIRPSFLPVRV